MENNYKPWKMSDINFLKKNWFEPVKYLSKELGRSKSAIWAMKVALKKEGHKPIDHEWKEPRKASEIVEWLL